MGSLPVNNVWSRSNLLGSRYGQEIFTSRGVVPVPDDGSNPPVALSRESLDKLRPFSVVVQCIPEPAHCLAETVLEVNKRVGRPKPLSKFFSRDQFAGTLQQDQQNLEGLALEGKFFSVSPHFGGNQINLEVAEANLVLRLSRF